MSDLTGSNAPFGLSPRRLALSIVLAVVIWWFLLNLNFALILTFSILIHEYGHYYWMGREGIVNRDMTMIPPFGAMAISSEQWPSYKAEMRIAIAGPVFGLIPIAVFFVLFLATHSTMWLAGIAVASFINLFNLAPILPLDGGRCVRAVLTSLHPSLQYLCFAASSIFAFMMVISGFTLMGLIILYLLWGEVSNFLTARRFVATMGPLLNKYLETKKEILDANTINPLSPLLDLINKEIGQLEGMLKSARDLLNMPRMNARACFVSLAGYLLVAATHFLLLSFATQKLGLSLLPTTELFKYF